MAHYGTIHRTCAPNAQPTGPVTTRVTWTGPRPTIYAPPNSWIINFAVLGQVNHQLKIILEGPNGEAPTPQILHGRVLFVQGIDRSGVVYWDEAVCSGGERSRFCYFDYVDVENEADVPDDVVATYKAPLPSGW